MLRHIDWLFTLNDRAGCSADGWDQQECSLMYRVFWVNIYLFPLFVLCFFLFDGVFMWTSTKCGMLRHPKAPAAALDPNSQQAHQPVRSVDPNILYLVADSIDLNHQPPTVSLFSGLLSRMPFVRQLSVFQRVPFVVAYVLSVVVQHCNAWCRGTVWLRAGILAAIDQARSQRIVRDDVWQTYVQRGNFVEARQCSHATPMPHPKQVLTTVILSLVFSFILVVSQDAYISGYTPSARPETPGETPSEADYDAFANIYPVHIAFRDLGCDVGHLEHSILNRVTGEIQPGRVTAILGPSGAGKSVFASMLLGKPSFCSVTRGSVFLNGKERSLEAILDRVGFVPQEDQMFAHLTVEELVRFSASLRLPKTLTAKQIDQAVDQTLVLLDLQDLRDVPIRTKSRRTLSGGEKKRVSIALELVAQPSVLIMDEPTTGLDSVNALRLMQYLEKIAHKGVSVVTILHLPSTRQFNLIEDLILLKQGDCVFVGPRTSLPKFWGSLGFNVPGVSTTSLPRHPSSIARDMNQRRGADVTPHTSPSQPPVHDSSGNFPGTCTSSHSSTPVRNPARIAFVEYILDVLAEVDEYPAGVRMQTAHFAARMASDAVAGKLTLGELWQAHMRRTRHWEFMEKKMEQFGNVNGGASTRREDSQKGQSVFRMLSRGTSSRLKTTTETGDAAVERNNSVGVGSEHGGGDETLPTSSFKNFLAGRTGFMIREIDEDHCMTLEFVPRRQMCLLLVRMWSRQTQFPVVRKPGVYHQVEAWVFYLLRMRVRSQVFRTECQCITILGMLVGWIRSYSDDWAHKASTNIVLSVAVCTMTVLIAISNDTIQPVERAIKAGSSLSAYHLALSLVAYIEGAMAMTWFALCDYVTIWVRRGQPKYPVSNWKKHFEWVYILFMFYQVSYSIGSIVCVLTRHHFAHAFLVSLCVVMSCHVFALFSPNQRQVELDSMVLNKYNIKWGVLLFGALSPVRHFMEAMFLFEPPDEEVMPRKFTMKYFGYKDVNMSRRVGTLFVQFHTLNLLREVVFAHQHLSDFHLSYEHPLIIRLFMKLFLYFGATAGLGMFLHEWPAGVLGWHSARHEYNMWRAECAVGDRR